MKKQNIVLSLFAAVAFSFSAYAPFAVAKDAAESWPDRAVTWVVPFPPGGAMDVMARAIGEDLSRDLGQPFVIENKPGAGGNIGAQYVAKQKPDGYTMMITSIGMATNAHLYRNLAYDPINDFDPVTLLAVVPNVLVVNADNKEFTTIDDVIQKTRDNPGKYTYASAGNGTSIHLAGASFASLINAEILHIPYKGSSPAVMDLLGGQVDMMFDSITSAKTHIDSGKLRALGLTTANPSATLPGVPPLAKAGVPDYEVSPWFAIFVPANTPPALVDKMNKALLNSLEKTEIKQRLANIGAESVGSSPAEMKQHLSTETTRWGDLIKEIGIRLD